MGGIRAGIVTLIHSSVTPLPRGKVTTWMESARSLTAVFSSAISQSTSQAFVIPSTSRSLQFGSLRAEEDA